MLALILNPYFILAATFLLASSFGAGFATSSKFNKAESATAEVKYITNTVTVERKQSATTAVVEKKAAAVAEKTRIIYRDIDHEITVYAKTPHATCLLDDGWVRIHDAAALGLPAVTDSASK